LRSPEPQTFQSEGNRTFSESSRKTKEAYQAFQSQGNRRSSFFSRSQEYQAFQSQNECISPEYGCEIYKNDNTGKLINMKRKTSSKMIPNATSNRFSSNSSDSSKSSEEDSSSPDEDVQKKSLASKERKKLEKLRRKSENMSDSEMSSGNDSEGQTIFKKKKKMSKESSLPKRIFISSHETKNKVRDGEEILDRIVNRKMTTCDKELLAIKKHKDIDKRRVELEDILERIVDENTSSEDKESSSTKRMEALEKRKVELDEPKTYQRIKFSKNLSESLENNFEGSKICDREKSREPSFSKISNNDGNKVTIDERIINQEIDKSENRELRQDEDNCSTQTNCVENVTTKKRKTKQNQEKVFQLSLQKGKSQNKIFNIHCAFCEMDFGDVTEMRAHVQANHTDMLFQCKLCSKCAKGFETTRGLMEHMKKTHGINKLLEQIIGEESSRESVQLPEKFLYKITCSHSSCTTRPELGRNGLWLGRNLSEIKEDIFLHNRLLHKVNAPCSDVLHIELSCRACTNFTAVDSLGRPDEQKWNKHFAINHVKRIVHNHKLNKQKKKSS
jgi:predicted small metal-binding protein